VLLNKLRLTLRLSTLAPISWFESLVIECLRFFKKIPAQMLPCLGLAWPRVRLLAEVR